MNWWRHENRGAMAEFYRACSSNVQEQSRCGQTCITPRKDRLMSLPESIRRTPDFTCSVHAVFTALETLHHLGIKRPSDFLTVSGGKVILYEQINVLDWIRNHRDLVKQAEEANSSRHYLNEHMWLLKRSDLDEFERSWNSSRNRVNGPWDRCAVTSSGSSVSSEHYTDTSLFPVGGQAWHNDHRIPLSAARFFMNSGQNPTEVGALHSVIFDTTDNIGWT